MRNLHIDKETYSSLNIKDVGDYKYIESPDFEILLIDYAFENDVRVGFDSCSAPMFLEAVKDRENYKTLEQMSEPCESYLFSFYVNVEGKTTPCSFLQDRGYEEIDVAVWDDFLKDIWNAFKTCINSLIEIVVERAPMTQPTLSEYYSNTPSCFYTGD